MNDFFIGGSMSDSSKRLYMHNLKKLNDNKPIENFNYLKKTEEVMKRMPPNRNTSRSYIIACVNATKGRKGFKKALEFYTNQMNLINAELKDSTKKSDRYLNEEVSWDYIIQKRDALPKASVEYVLMCLFTMMPPRRNLDYIAKIGKPQENSNWYDGVNFYFGNYKTKGAYHTQVVPVPTELKHVIEYYLDHRPFKCNDLLVKRNGLSFKTKDIQMALNKVIEKKVGCTMLRSIYLSSKYKDVLEDMKEDATAMGTSTSIIQQTYVKH
jgi:hypothetical protein